MNVSQSGGGVILSHIHTPHKVVQVNAYKQQQTYKTYICYRGSLYASKEGYVYYNSLMLTAFESCCHRIISPLEGR